MMVDDRNLTFRSVVFATDFSAGSRAAGRYAALFARHYQVDLIVAHAFLLNQPAAEVELAEHMSSQQRRELEQRLRETVENLAESAGTVRSVLRNGTPLDVVRETSDKHGPGLVVLGTHGAGALEHHIIGSVAEDIVRHIGSPVLTVGPHVESPTSRELILRRILYATDFSPASAAAAPYAIGLARSFDSGIDLMHVVSGDARGDRHRRKEQEEAFLTALAQLVPNDAGDLSRSRTFVEGGEIRDRILEHAAERHTDLIVLGAHHHSHLAMHFRTGPAFHVIQAATCPVLTIGCS